MGIVSNLDGIVWKNHWFSLGFCRFYVRSGDVGLRAILGSTRRQLKLTWSHLGPTLDRLGPNFLHLGAILGHSAAILVRTWALMKPPWCQLGPTKRHMEPDRTGSRAIWSRLGANLDQLGVGLTNLGSV